MNWRSLETDPFGVDQLGKRIIVAAKRDTKGKWGSELKMTEACIERGELWEMAMTVLPPKACGGFSHTDEQIALNWLTEARRSNTHWAEIEDPDSAVKD